MDSVDNFDQSADPAQHLSRKKPPGKSKTA